MTIRSWLAAASGGREQEFARVIGLTAVQGFLWSIMIPVLPLFARTLGASEIHLGTISTMPAFINIVGSIPGSALTLRFGKRAMFLATHVMGLLCAGLFAITNRLEVIIFPQLIFGLTNMLFWPTQGAYLTDLIPREMRTRVMGYTMAITGVGMTLGPILGGFLIDNAGYHAVFATYALVSVSGFLLAFSLPRGLVDTSVSALQALRDGVSGVRDLLTRPMLRVLTLNTFFVFFNVGMTDAFFPVLLKEAGYSATWVGSTVTIRTAGITVVRLIVGLLAAKVGAIPLLFTGGVLCAVSLGLVPLFTNPGFVLLASFVMGMAFGMVPVLNTAALAEYTNSRERPVAMALDGTTVNIGRVMNGFAIGAIAQQVGFGSALVYGNLFVLSGLALVMGLYAGVSRRSSQVLQRLEH